MPTVRLAAVSDIHYTRNSHGALVGLFARAAEQADVLLLGGDLTDYGLVEEARALAEDLRGVRIPVIAVLGNHDLESGQGDEVRRILCDAGVRLLDGESVVVDGVGFAGAKGFAGGFGRRALEPWGEAAIKMFVREAIDEALKLEQALARLRTRLRIVLLHYSPVRATVEGEPPEIHPFLGSSRLEEPINRFKATAVFHGHAHAGTLEGATATGIPVYNVALPLLRRRHPEGPGFKVLEFELPDEPRALNPSPAG